MRYGTHSPHLSHRPFAHTGQVALDVLQALALCLGHAKHDEHQAHQTDTAEQPERPVGAEHPQQVGERFGHYECAGPVEGCGQRGGRASDFGWNKHTRNEDYRSWGGGVRVIRRHDLTWPPNHGYRCQWRRNRRVTSTTNILNDN